MKTHARLIAALFFGTVSLSAQTIYVPGGTVGTSSNGNVGVGIANPVARFDVYGGSLATTVGSRLDVARFASSTANSERLEVFQQRRATGANWDTADLVLQRKVDSTPMGFLKFTGFDTVVGTGTSDYFVVKNGGNVGIGTTSPTQKLSVNGTIRAKEVIVDTGWSDYVFEDDYRLAPLAEVEAHIREKKHLPGIPSAREVAEGGVSLGEMQARLLAKIEELTLHQIEQEKEIKLLRSEVAELREETFR